MSDEDARMSKLRYKNSTFSYRDTFEFPRVTRANCELVVYVHSSTDLDNFSYRENSPTLAFFAHSEDPEMKRVLDILIPLSTKLLIVDIGAAPDLRDRFHITKPTLMRIFKGRILHQLLLPPTEENICRFVNPPSNARWRSVDHR